MQKIIPLFLIITFCLAGSKKPVTPLLFGDGIISTEDDEFGFTISPDGKTCFFTKKTASTIQSSTYIICYTTLKNGNWTQPEIASFSGKYKDFNPMFSPDGSKLFFISNRPGPDKKTYDGDIWIVKRNGDAWSEPENIGVPINTRSWQLGCSATSNGTLYFSTVDSTGNADIYSSAFMNGSYQQPQSVGDAINTPNNEEDPFIAADESYLLFSSLGRSDALSGSGADSSYPRKDIYISFKKDGKWQPAKNLGAPVNSNADESCPVVSLDGKTLFFTSARSFVTIPMKTRLTYQQLEKGLHQPGNGLGDIYQVPTTVIDKFH